MTQSALELERLVVDLETGVRGYMLTDDAASWSPIERGRSRSRAWTELQRLAAELQAARRRIDRDLAPTSRLHRAADPRTRRACSRPRPRASAASTSCAPVRRAQPRAARSTAQRRDRSQALRHRMLVLAAGGAVLSVALLVLLALLPAPLRAAPRPPRRRAPPSASPHGHLDTRVPATGLGEIGQLGASFNAMAAALAARERGPARPDRPAAGDPRPHDDDDLGQGPRRPLPAGQRRVAHGDGPGRRRRASAAPTTSCSRPTSPPRSASPTSRSCAPARPASTSATPRPAAARSSSSSSRSRTPTAASTPPARWAPTSASASARSPRPSRPRARSPSSWPT